MCGIVGAVSNRPVCDILVDGLQRLEYRGYDSAGVTILDGAGSASCIKRQGKVGGPSQCTGWYAVQWHSRH